MNIVAVIVLPAWVRTQWVETGHNLRLGTESFAKRLAGVDNAPEKLRSLARQSRALAGLASDRARAQALHSLARLYEQQASECEAEVDGPFAPAWS
jgi:hypothetical protein